ncbi:unnamed protein product [Amoebophrya sp. A25]|nr:unnamed protein product [Amoebophrya sp. A25]|eukprot:GSA25T00003521001.1
MQVPHVYKRKMKRLQELDKVLIPQAKQESRKQQLEIRELLPMLPQWQMDANEYICSGSSGDDEVRHKNFLYHKLDYQFSNFFESSQQTQEGEELLVISMKNDLNLRHGNAVVGEEDQQNKMSIGLNVTTLWEQGQKQLSAFARRYLDYFANLPSSTQAEEAGEDHHVIADEKEDLMAVHTMLRTHNFLETTTTRSTSIEALGDLRGELRSLHLIGGVTSSRLKTAILQEFSKGHEPGIRVLKNGEFVTETNETGAITRSRLFLALFASALRLVLSALQETLITEMTENPGRFVVLSPSTGEDTTEEKKLVQCSSILLQNVLKGNQQYVDGVLAELVPFLQAPAQKDKTSTTSPLRIAHVLEHVLHPVLLSRWQSHKQELLRTSPRLDEAELVEPVSPLRSPLSTRSAAGDRAASPLPSIEQEQHLHQNEPTLGAQGGLAPAPQFFNTRFRQSRSPSPEYQIHSHLVPPRQISVSSSNGGGPRRASVCSSSTGTSEVDSLVSSVLSSSSTTRDPAFEFATERAILVATDKLLASILDDQEQAPDHLHRRYNYKRSLQLLAHPPSPQEEDQEQSHLFCKDVSKLAGTKAGLKAWWMQQEQRNKVARSKMRKQDVVTEEGPNHFQDQQEAVPFVPAQFLEQLRHPTAHAHQEA